MNSATPDGRGHLFGASGRHARVVVATVTDKEFPVAWDVFGACGPLAEIDHLAAYASEEYVGESHVPFVLVQAADRGNLAIMQDINEWIFQFRPQAFLVVGTAGGVWRPENEDRTVWNGAPRGDVVISEYIHFGDYRKVTAQGTFARHHRLDQPSSQLIKHARAISANPDGWHRWLGPLWEGEPQLPRTSEVEILAAGQIQDQPLDAAQQWLMEAYDRAGAAEMESAGVAQSLHSMRRDATYAPIYLSIRGISDLIWARDAARPLNEEDVEKAKAFDEVQTTGPGEAGKTAERESWSPRAAAAASAFALAMVERLARRPMPALPGHPPIPGFSLEAVGGGA